MRKIIQIFKNISVPLLTISFPLGYLWWVISFKRRGILSEGDFINIVAIFIGWIVALLIAWIHLKKTREDNLKLKKEEIRRSLEIDTFREINKAITSFSSMITNVSTAYLIWPSNLKLHIQNPEIFKFNKMEIDLEISQQVVNLLRGSADFILAIESNEIAVIQFDHLRKYIQFKVDDVNESIRNFQKYFIEMEKEKWQKEEGYVEFKRKCDEIYEELNNIQSYLFDYRIELMNSLMGEIFDKKVPERRPRDPKYKTLKELAIKEKVEKEAEVRELRALKGKE